MKREQRFFLIWRYVTFFLLIAFVITCSFFVFLHSMELDASLIRRNAVVTFLNILLLSLFCCGVEGLLRRFTVDKPIQRIHEATRRMADGDLSARIDTSDLPSYNADFIGIAEDFNLMAKELSSTETLRTDFVSNVSHELKTPLAVMRNYAALLKQPGLSEAERREYAAGIDGSFNLCDVRDLADGTIRAAERGRSGECYILGNREVRFKDFARMIAEEAGTKPMRMFLPLGMASLMGKMMEKQARRKGTKPLMTSFSVYNLARNNCFDSTNAPALLREAEAPAARGWHPKDAPRLVAPAFGSGATAEKAMRELGYRTRSYQETMHDEIQWLIETGKVKMPAVKAAVMEPVPAHA